MFLDGLYSVTALGLGLSAWALGTSGRAGATRALAALLTLNALLVARALVWGQPGFDWVSSAPFVVGSQALFALSPPLLALAALRARSGGPLHDGDGRAFLPPAFAAALLAIAWASRGGWPGAPVEGVYVASLLVLGVVCVEMAARAVRGIPERARRAGRAVVGVFAAHWALSLGSWAAGLAGLPGARGLEALSVASLLAFGLGAGAWGLRRLPAVLLRAPTPLVGPPAGPGPSGLDADRREPGLEARAPETDAADAALADRLLELLDGERVWLDPELTVEALADRLREPTRDVSRVLNGPVGGGFHRVVGARRVAEAKRLLADEPDATVLEVLYRVGFSSKSAFHRAFKRHAGLTPTAYRRAVAEAPRGDGQDVPVPVPGRREPASG